MDLKIENLLKKINFDEVGYKFFFNAKIDRIVINEDEKIWNIYFHNNTNFPAKIIEELLDGLKKHINNKYQYNIFVSVDNEELLLVEEYYQYILVLINNNHLYQNMFNDRFIKENDEYFIEVYNKMENTTINKKISDINKYFSDFGFNVKLNIRLNNEKSLEIKESIKNDINTKIEVKTAPKMVNNVLLGHPVKGKITKLNEINFEVDNVNVEVFVFGVDPFAKNGFYSLNLKVSDFTTSMYTRIYLTDKDEFERLSASIKENMWLKINGYIKNNTFYNDFVINARNIEIIESKEEKILDNAKEKRVELHAHTLISQMDGLIGVGDLIKRAVAWGHKAIAITDHNAIQAFPEAYHHKNEIKILYGVELAMIDDDLDLIFREKDFDLLSSSYIVFDFETTGFNAGGGDSIIEVGAVKLENGEITDRFSKLINPGHKLNEVITNLTGITDQMLEKEANEETVIKEFIDWVGELPMVAHNAKFDASFLEMAYQKYNLGEYKNTLFDTLQISRALEPNHARHSLSALVKRYEVAFDEDSHHRGDYDAEATAMIFYKMLKILDSKNISNAKDINNLVSKEDIHKFGNLYHINILVKNQTGLKNLFKIVSLANTKYLFKTPRILRSVLTELKEGLIFGSSCANGEIFTLARSKSDEELGDLMNFYDYIEIQPPSNYKYLIQTEDFRSEEEMLDNVKKIISVAKAKGKLIVATGDVHHLDEKDKIYREIIINQKVPGGGRHQLNRPNITDIPTQHFRTTDEMLKEFSFLDKKLAKQIVIDNTNKIADLIEDIEIIPDTKGIPFSPRIENSKQIITDLVYDKAHELYGNPLPELIEERIEAELSGIINGGFDTIYLIAQKLVEKSNSDGYSVGSRGSVGSSFVATMLGITEVNPLPAHYVCPKCKKTYFEVDGKKLNLTYASGYDLPDKKCECGENLNKEGHDIPFATFLGFNADKVPDIDLNFSGDYQAKAHDYTKVLFGEDHVFRAGTIGTVAEKTAFGYVKGYYEDREITGIRNLEIERLAKGVTGVKRTTGQHPGGIVVVPDYKDVFDFTPYQYPADSEDSLWYTTHFNYHDIEDCLLKLDILGHDNPTIFKMLEDLTGINPNEVPMDDKEVMSLFTSTKALGVRPEQINCECGALGLPEFTRFVIGIVQETKPTTFAELVKISGLSHGTDVWNGNAQDLVRNSICEFKNVIGCRDDIMVNLINYGLEAIDAFKIMEFVRKGKPSKEKEQWATYKKLLQEKKVPDWYIDSCEKIKYMFPKAHATAYISAAFKIAWYKINRPLEYYAAFFSIRCFAFDLECLEMGYQKIKERLEELQIKKFGLTPKEVDLITTLENALEMSARGFKFGSVDLAKSDSKNFIIDDDKMTLIPPFRALDGLGEVVAVNIIKEREKGEFLSIEDLQKRAKISSTIIEKMRLMGILKNMPESSQLSLFDM